jgi:hypothetical protein
MAQIPRDSYTAFTSAPAFEDTSARAHVSAHEDEMAPLRFGADERSRQGSPEAYRAPRASRFRTIQGPLLFAAVCGALIAVTWTAWTTVLEAIAEGAADLAAREGDGRAQVSATVGLVALATLGFVVAWWRGSHPQRAVRLSDDRGRMAVDAIAGQLRASFLHVDEVRDAEVRVENRGRSRVRVRAWLRVSPEARIDDVLDGIDEAAEWLVHHRLGLLLSEPPLADVKYDELDLRMTRPAAPLAPERTRAGRTQTSDDEDA